MHINQLSILTFFVNFFCLLLCSFFVVDTSVLTFCLHFCSYFFSSILRLDRGENRVNLCLIYIQGIVFKHVFLLFCSYFVVDTSILTFFVNFLSIFLFLLFSF